MSSHNPSLDQPAESTDSTEARMRLALGLGSRPAAPGHGASPTSSSPTSHDPARQRRRFAQDGEVPVVMLHRGRDGDASGENKVAALTADLREERSARLKSERALEEANALIQSLRTKLKHTEMTWDEKLRDEREARARVDALLLTEREARAQAEVKAAEAALALSVLERAAPPVPPVTQAAPPPPIPEAEVPASRDLFEDAAAPDAAASLPRRRAARKTKAAPEPSLPLAVESDDEQPIEWWLPSFRAARGAPARKKRATG
jgi:hypothetical protein